MADPSPKRYVVLEHDYQGVHYDLMFDWGGVLKTWRVPEPIVPGVQTIEPSFDHRNIYLDYEGPVSGNRGVVRRWDHGWYEGDLGPDGFRARLFGERLRGEVEIVLDLSGAVWLRYTPAPIVLRVPTT